MNVKNTEMPSATSAPSNTCQTLSTVQGAAAGHFHGDTVYNSIFQKWKK